jgi:hypothetical protein
MNRSESRRAGDNVGTFGHREVIPMGRVWTRVMVSEGFMRHWLSDRRRPAKLAIAVILALVTGLGISAANAQRSTTILRTGNPTPSVVTTGSGDYYIEFRARYAWDYGHTYLVHGRVGVAPTKADVAGLSPVGDDSTAWVIGHYVPVPAETGWTDGDLENKYVTARYRVLMSKEEYDRVLDYIKGLQGRSHVWSAELYNCNAFVGEVANFMGLKVPASSLIYPKVFVTHLRLLNTGHADAAETLVSDNVKEMSNPTRDGRAMINNHVYTIGPNGEPESRVGRATPASTPTPKVTIGQVRVSSRAGN